MKQYKNVKILSMDELDIFDIGDLLPELIPGTTQERSSVSDEIMKSTIKTEGLYISDNNTPTKYKRIMMLYCEECMFFQGMINNETKEEAVACMATNMSDTNSKDLYDRVHNDKCPCLVIIYGKK